MNQSIRAEEEEEEEKFSMVDLPTHITTEILSRLPVKTLLHCQVVCKHWLRSLTSDPHFAHLHLSKSPITLLIRAYHLHHHCLIDPLLQTPNTHPKHAQLKLFPGLNYPLSGHTVVNSCNGLLCFYTQRDPSFFVCNPILREYISLPISIPEGCYDNTSAFSAFGFSPKSKKYKVVHFYTKKKWSSSGVERVKAKAEIYTLGEGPWRNLGTVPFLLLNDPFYASLKGAFHWLTFKSRSPDFIRCFDFDSEQLRVVHGPPEFGIHKKKFRDRLTDVTHVSLGVLRGSLSICDFPSQFCVEVWMMKDYGIKESWTKEFVIENGICSRRDVELLHMVEPIMILESGDILMLVNRRSLVQYNPKLGSLKNLNIYGFKSGFYAAGYIPSFVSLRDAAKGERLTLLSASTGRKRKRAGSSYATSASIGKKI